MAVVTLKKYTEGVILGQSELGHNNIEGQCEQKMGLPLSQHVRSPDFQQSPTIRSLLFSHSSKVGILEIRRKNESKKWSKIKGAITVS